MRPLLALLLTATAALSTLAAESLVIYSGRSEKLIAPVIAAAQAATGLTIEVRYGTTPALAAQLAAEGAQTRCDIFFAQEAGYLAALAEAHLLAPLPEAALARVDERFRDRDGRWVGTSGRLRVLVLNGQTIAEADRPTSLDDLTDPRWRGKIGWAPGNASFQAHVSVLRALWGEERTRAWLTAMKANAAHTYQKNGAQVVAVDSGEITIGWVNHYYLHQARTSGPGAAINHSFPSSASEGNVLMMSGVGRVRTSKQAAQADQLIAWLLSDEAQTLFTAGFEYPTVTGVAIAPEVPPLAEIPLATFDQSVLTDLPATIDLLRQVGLQ